mmetsp:Transcript_39329/g.95177  ORF Transcript_39329/g.95177 Transcript_39329/m.95177 type:complete len:113 (+) Transcript_39329:265-603(+)
MKSVALHVVFKYSFHQQQVARQSTGGSGMLESITALIHHPKTFLIVHPFIHPSIHPLPYAPPPKRSPIRHFDKASLCIPDGMNFNESVRSPNCAHAVVLVATTTTRCSIPNQ